MVVNQLQVHIIGKGAKQWFTLPDQHRDNGQDEPVHHCGPQEVLNGHAAIQIDVLESALKQSGDDL